MRDDMARVIVERPRRPDKEVRKGRARPLDALPQKQGLRRFQRERGGQKYLNENLVPLRRYLDKQVGRPWDKVYAEVSARLRADNVVQQHVRDHLKDFVATTPRRGIHPGFRRQGRSEGLWHQPLYVDPRDGILKRTDSLPEEKVGRRKQAEARRATTPVERIALAPDRALRCLNGIWYEITLAPLPEPTYAGISEKLQARLDKTGTILKKTLVTPPVCDLITGEIIPVGPDLNNAKAWADYRRRYPDRRHAVAKRQISAAELRRHGLTNRLPPER